MKRNIYYNTLVGVLLALSGCHSHDSTRSKDLQRAVARPKSESRLNEETSKSQQFSLDSRLTQEDSDLNTDPYYIHASYWVNTKPLFRKDLEGKTVMLNFWAPWNRESVRELPDLEKMYREGNNSTIVIGIVPETNLTDEKMKKYQKFVKGYHISYPVLIDVGEISLKKHEINQFPQKVVISEGKATKLYSLRKYFGDE